MYCIYKCNLKVPSYIYIYNLTLYESNTDSLIRMNNNKKKTSDQLYTKLKPYSVLECTIQHISYV